MNFSTITSGTWSRYSLILKLLQLQLYQRQSKTRWQRLGLHHQPSPSDIKSNKLTTAAPCLQMKIINDIIILLTFLSSILSFSNSVILWKDSRLRYTSAQLWNKHTKQNIVRLTWWLWHYIIIKYDHIRLVSSWDLTPVGTPLEMCARDHTVTVWPLLQISIS